MIQKILNNLHIQYEEFTQVDNGKLVMLAYSFNTIQTYWTNEETDNGVKFLCKQRKELIGIDYYLETGRVTVEGNDRGFSGNYTQDTLQHALEQFLKDNTWSGKVQDLYGNKTLLDFI